ncbi:MAG: hypothetical protein H0V28_08690 [Rubrobacteraceae bacterium]|nr:hypothetical protein [Rubrobacteraceae bacterium]
MSAGTGGMAGLAARDGYRRGLLVFASAAVVFGLMHHTDHVIRGNHSGWPFQAEVTPFTFSLLIYAIILPGIYLTARRHSIPGYHRFVALVGLALLGFVHFVPTGDYEAPIQDIYMVYEGPLAGMLALVVLAGLITSVAALGIVALGAIRARSRSTEGG